MLIFPATIYDKKEKEKSPWNHIYVFDAQIGERGEITIFTI